MSIPEEEISDATVRSRRRTQMPRYLEDYEVDYVPDQQLVRTHPQATSPRENN